MMSRERHIPFMIKRLFLLCTASLLPFSIAPALASKPAAKDAAYERTAPWNAETSDMVPDDRIIYGRLKNGLRYAIRPNAKPENQVLIRMVVDFGSAAEADDEQGLAHFIEHMAFNGSTNVPEGEMVRILERLGLSFGADTNASTGFLKTTYMLDLPRKDAGLIEQAFFLMRETASEVRFNPDAVQRERGVVLSEMRDGENFYSKRNRESFRLFYPDSFYAKRFPIGQKEVLESAKAEQMKALYKKWYTPDRTRLIVVGPVDPKTIEQEIARKFSSWTGNGAALGKLKQCNFDTARPAGGAVFVHPEIDEQVMIEQLVADKARPDTMETALLQLKMEFAWGIISDRLSRRSRKEDIPYLYSGPNFEAGFCDKYARVGLAIGSKDGGWKTVLPIVEQTVRQAVEHGFSQAELNEQMKRFDASYANAIKSETTATSGGFAGELAGSDDNVISSAQYRQLAWLQLKPFLTEAAIRAELRKWYSQLESPQILLSTKKSEQIDSSTLLTAFQESRKVAVAAPATRDIGKWAYTDFGTPGVVAADKRIDDLGIRTVRFENGVLLNLKKTDFEADRAGISMRIDGGRMEFGNEALPSISLMNGAYVGGGLGKHQIDDLRALLAGSTADVGLYASDDHYGASGTVVVKDMELQFQLMAAFLTDPGYRDEAVRLYRRPIPENYARLDATPGSALGRGQSRILYDDDPRFSILPLETIMAADFDGLKKLITDPLKNNRLEIGIVGAIDEEQAIQMVGRTLGALPKRKQDSVVKPEARIVRFSGKTGAHDFYHRGEPNQMAWRRVWPTTDGQDLKLSQTVALLSEVVQIRLLDELREKLGAAYGANASSSMSTTYADFGTFSVATNGNPKDLSSIEETVEAVIAEIVSKPVEADLLQRARKPIEESFRDWRKRNRTWVGLAAEAQTDPDKLERFRKNEELFRSITADDVWKAAQRFLKEKPSYTFRALPKPAEAAAPVVVK
jgi:zinc protease